MDTKKTIIVSIITTLATMFIVAVIIHMCHGRCGQSKCGKAAVQCGSSYGHGDYHGAHGGCASYAKSCHAKKSCKSGKSCSSKSKCSKASKCCKSKSSCSKKGNVKTCKYKDGKKIIIKKEIVEEAKE